MGLVLGRRKVKPNSSRDPVASMMRLIKSQGDAAVVLIHDAIRGACWVGAAPLVLGQVPVDKKQTRGGRAQFREAEATTRQTDANSPIDACHL